MNGTGGANNPWLGKLSSVVVNLVAPYHAVPRGPNQAFNIPGPAGAQPKPKTGPTGALEVDTYQIAVPNGDCSVHILAERTGTLQGKILNSIIMDGGNDGSPSAEQAADIIEGSLRVIRARYDQTGSPVIKFDAWIVTHWDNDHWAGSLKMFQRSMDGHGQSDRMKYDNHKPLTHLYCPNWAGLPKYAAVPEDPKGELLKKRPKELFIEYDDDSNFDEEAGTGQVYFRNHAQGNYPLCIAKWGHRKLLGIDFFTGDSPWHYLEKQKMDLSADHARQQVLSTVSEMKKVVQMANMRDIKYPRFVCIGVGGFVCGARLDKKALRAALGTQKMTPDDTWANMSSIMSVLYFPEEKHLSLYWGGDSITPIEQPLAESSFFNGYECSVAKWSHHGGRHSSPAELWRKLKPKRCVVSPNRTGKYLHPHFQTIQRFRDYAITQNINPMIYSTYYPGWILHPTEYGLKKVDGIKGLKQLRKDWHAVSPLQPDTLACPTYVLNSATQEYDYCPNGYTPPPKRGRPSTKRSTWQIQFIHILSSDDINRDGTIHPFALAYKSTKTASTTITTKDKNTAPTTIPLNMTTAQVVDVDNDPATDIYDIPVDSKLENEQWAQDAEEGAMSIEEEATEANDIDESAIVADMAGDNNESSLQFTWSEQQLQQQHEFEQFQEQQQAHLMAAYPQTQGYGQTPYQSQPVHDQNYYQVFGQNLGHQPVYGQQNYNQQPSYNQGFNQGYNQNFGQSYNQQSNSNYRPHWG